MNKIIVSGSLGRDSELKFTAAGKAVLNFSIAVNSGFGESKKTAWWRCALWGARAEKLVDHFKKGTKLLIMGEPDLREYEKDGVKKLSAEIFVNDFEFMNGKKEGGESDSFTDAGFTSAVDDADSVPF